MLDKIPRATMEWSATCIVPVGKLEPAGKIEKNPKKSGNFLSFMNPIWTYFRYGWFAKFGNVEFSDIPSGHFRQAEALLSGLTREGERP